MPLTICDLLDVSQSFLLVILSQTYICRAQSGNLGNPWIVQTKYLKATIISGYLI